MHETRDKIEGELMELESEINELESSADTATEETKEEVRGVREHYSKLKARLAELKDAGDEMWEEVKDEFRDGVDNVRDAYRKAKEKIN